MSPQSEPQFYLAAAQLLVDQYRSTVLANGPISARVPWIPLVVNSQGWVRGLGIDMLNRVVHHTLPRNIIQISGSTATKVLLEVLVLERNSPLSCGF